MGNIAVATEIQKEVFVCPFCREDQQTMRRQNNASQFYVLCMNCGGAGPPNISGEEAANLWNAAEIQMQKRIVGERFDAVEDFKLELAEKRGVKDGTGEVKP